MTVQAEKATSVTVWVRRTRSERIARRVSARVVGVLVAVSIRSSSVSWNSSTPVKPGVPVDPAGVGGASRANGAGPVGGDVTGQFGLRGPAVSGAVNRSTTVMLLGAGPGGDGEGGRILTRRIQARARPARSHRPRPGDSVGSPADRPGAGSAASPPAPVASGSLVVGPHARTPLGFSPEEASAGSCVVPISRRHSRWQLPRRGGCCRGGSIRLEWPGGRG